MTLNIEKLTEDLQLEKTAEEHEMEKIAHVVNVVEQGQTLTAVGEEMFKIASELENEELAALAQDTLDMGARFGACLTKTASEDGGALVEAVEIAEDLNKIASVYADIADNVNDEDFSKLAEAVIGISNELTDEANEMFAEIEKEAELEKEAGKSEGEDGYKAKGVWAGRGAGAGAGAVAGAGLGALLAKKYGISKGQGAALGAAIGGGAGLSVGSVAARVKQTRDHNKKEGYKHPLLRSFTPTAQGEMHRATSVGENLKSLDAGRAIAGVFGRAIHKK